MLKKMSIITVVVIFILAGCGISNKANKQNSANQTPQAMDSSENSSITNKYWKLVKLDGKNVTMAKNQEREAYFILKLKDKMVTGFAGCNTFSGSYTLEKGWRIRFSQMATTMKACPDVNVNEREFLEVFELADNYTIYNDTLSLNVGRRAPLAIFKAVYFK